MQFNSEILHPPEHIDLCYDNNLENVIHISTINNSIDVELMDYESKTLVRINRRFMKTIEEFKNIESIEGKVENWNKDITTINFSDGSSHRIDYCTPSMIARMMEHITKDDALSSYLDTTRSSLDTIVKESLKPPKLFRSMTRSLRNNKKKIINNM